MADEMSLAEYAVLPSSSVCIEALACGCKVASGYFVDNQIEFSQKLEREKYVFGLGNLTSVQDSTLIEKIVKFDYNKTNPFEGVRKRYIEVFKNL